MNTKQVIVVRKDLNMRKGKIAGQCAHASLKVILDLMYTVKVQEGHGRKIIETKNLDLELDSPLYNWINGLFTKVVLSVNSEEELLNIYNQAKEMNLLCSLIQDAGKTEFHGIPTYTCCAIGPELSCIIDKITGGLPLL